MHDSPSGVRIPSLRAGCSSGTLTEVRKQVAFIALASLMVTAAGVAWLRISDVNARDRAVREAAVAGSAPPFEADVWTVEEEAPLDKWSAWQMSVFKPGRGVTCWRFLVLPRGTTDEVAFRESNGTAACSRDRAQRYTVDPRVRACQFIGRVPTWRDRFVQATDFENSACAATS